MSWEVIDEYINHSAKKWDQRPAYDQLYGAIARCEVDLMMVWSVDRLSRSLPLLVRPVG